MLDLDNQKIMYHLDDLSEWLTLGYTQAPIYLEVSLTNACNHRCSFCAMDFRRGRDFIDKHVLLDFLAQMEARGLKSVMFGGEGEPMLHPDFVEIAKKTKLLGLDIALTTNGSLLTQTVSRGTMAFFSWVKASVDAGTPKTYAKIHGVKPGIFQVVIDNMEFAKSITWGTETSLGLQLLWLPENKDEVETLAELAKEIGMDYLVVKPYDQHPSSKTRTYENLDYRNWERVYIPNFDIIYRDNAFARNSKPDTCYALPFWAFLDCRGDLWACSSFLGEKEFLIGNAASRFGDIWPEKSLTEMKTKAGCRLNCRMAEVNEYLCRLKNHPKHLNFI